jgi:hypothetical protein
MISNNSSNILGYDTPSLCESPPLKQEVLGGKCRFAHEPAKRGMRAGPITPQLNTNQGDFFAKINATLPGIFLALPPLINSNRLILPKIRYKPLKEPMKDALKLTPIPSAARTGAVLGIILALLLSLGLTRTARAQGEVASGIISSTGTGPYTYNISFSDGSAASVPIGSVWYAWTPGNFYLPAGLSSAFAPVGWTAHIFGASIQYTANSSASYIPIGGLQTGFGYIATFSPATLAAAPNSGLSVAYSGDLGPDNGTEFTVAPGVVPEPSSLALLVVGAAGWFCFARRKHRAA